MFGDVHNILLGYAKNASQIPFGGIERDAVLSGNGVICHAPGHHLREVFAI